MIFIHDAHDGFSTVPNWGFVKMSIVLISEQRPPFSKFAIHWRTSHHWSLSPEAGDRRMLKSLAMQVLVNGKTHKMQRHPCPSGHRKNKAGSQKERKVLNKKAKEINQAASIQSFPTDSPRTSKAPHVRNYNRAPKHPMPQPRIVTLEGSEDSEPSLDYSTPCILPTSADVEASQKCTDDTEPPSLPSISCEATDPCATSMSTGSDSPRLLAALVEMLELKMENISLTGKSRNQREVLNYQQRRRWDLEEELHNYLRVSIKQECEGGMKWRGRIISELESSLRLWVEESESLVLAAGQVSARIVPYGSFRLGVVDTGVK